MLSAFEGGHTAAVTSLEVSGDGVAVYSGTGRVWAMPGIRSGAGQLSTVCCSCRWRPYLVVRDGPQAAVLCGA
jgi:hypothetical protein